MLYEETETVETRVQGITPPIIRTTSIPQRTGTRGELGLDDFREITGYKDFTDIYQCNFQRLYSYACQIIRDKSEAEDILQVSFHRASRYLHRFKPKDSSNPRHSLDSWLTRIVHNTAINAVRKRNHTPLPIDPDWVNEFTDGRTAETIVFYHEIISFLYADGSSENANPNNSNSHLGQNKSGRDKSSLRDLPKVIPDKFRQTLQLYAIDGLTMKEIAQELNILVGTALSRTHRGRKHLKKYLTRIRDGGTSER